MSTKTLRKRIALVAVVSMGFGLLSTVPANAGAAAVTDVSVTVTSGQTADPSLSITTGSGATAHRQQRRPASSGAAGAAAGGAGVPAGYTG